MPIDVLSILSKNSKLIVSPAYVRWIDQNRLNPLMDPATSMAVIEQLQSVPRKRSGSFSASSAGSCERSQVFGYHGADAERTDVGLNIIFNDGSWRHARWQAILLSAGILTDIEFPLFWNSKRQRGTMDGVGVVPDDHFVKGWRGKEFGFELKGVNAFSYPKLVKDNAPMPKHLAQVARYFLLSGLELFSLVYENKSTQEFHEWVLTRHMLAEMIEAQREEVEYLLTHVEDGMLPPMLDECQAGKGAFKTCGYGGPDGVCLFAEKSGNTLESIEVHRGRA